jgi:Protein of unknown function (DUF2849)
MAEKPLRRRVAGPFVVSASDLWLGHVVWLGARDRWVHCFAHAARFDGADAETVLARIQPDAREREVVDVHVVDVSETPAGLRPVTYRERIRATGPTIAIGSTAEILHGDRR